MLDTSNFMLQNSDGFGKPTDTILHGQVLKAEQQLLSAFSPTNLSIGRFFLKMQSNGNLVRHHMTRTLMSNVIKGVAYRVSVGPTYTPYPRPAHSLYTFSANDGSSFVIDLSSQVPSLNCPGNHLTFPCNSPQCSALTGTSFSPSCQPPHFTRCSSGACTIPLQNSVDNSCVKAELTHTTLNASI
ncbi:hypothetical protein EJ110_NYTH22332 [Nymphaea thermarum]|nr:hypothetical protein EJ110_NYTH22332 [Nymphaea thermarum]